MIKRQNGIESVERQCEEGAEEGRDKDYALLAEITVGNGADIFKETAKKYRGEAR